MEYQDGLEKGRCEMLSIYNPNAIEPPEEEKIYCPVCYAELGYGDKVYFIGREIIGCTECIRSEFVEDVDWT